MSNMVRQEGFEPSLEGFLAIGARIELTFRRRLVPTGFPLTYPMKSPVSAVGLLPRMDVAIPLPLALTWDRRNVVGAVTMATKRKGI